jgi:23S rRNA (cytidine1920-2'-O)/16S rRNA (cytidine1409-2'-O)-methyltransferase
VFSPAVVLIDLVAREYFSYNTAMTEKIRIDHLLVDLGLAESRSQAQRLVMAGVVRVNGQRVPKPSIRVNKNSTVKLDQKPRFVSRGGEKLQAAVEAFDLNIAGKICADIGVSTGGFTDCLLKNGAKKVYAVDVGQGILHWKLRNDPRVISMEGVNARYLESFPEAVTFITIDVSFISLKVILPVVMKWVSPADIQVETENDSHFPQVIALIKPQFEAGKKQAAKNKGVIRDPVIHHRVLLDVLTFANRTGFSIAGLLRSPIKGPKGNIEFLAHLQTEKSPVINHQVIEALVNQIMGDIQEA